MKKLLLLAIIAAFFGFSSQPVIAEPHIDEMGSLIEEVSLLNLLRGLYLSEEQATKISALAIEAKHIRQETISKIKKLNTLPVLKKLRDELYTALAEKPPQIREKAVELDNENHILTGKALTKIAKMEDQLKKILSPGQLNIFWEFSPCVVPELDFENPTRAGQAAATSRLMPVVDLIRSASDNMWKKHGQAYMNHILKIIEQEAGKMTDEVREDMRRRLVKQAWKVRQMSEPDYLLRKESLAGGFMLVNREHTLRSGYRKTGKLARFFLSDAAANVMPKWVEIHFKKKENSNKTNIIIPEKKKSCTIEQSESSKLPLNIKNEDKDKYFWEVQVPDSISRLGETPFLQHLYCAFPLSHSKAMFNEEDQYVDKCILLNGLAPILTGKGKMQYYSKVEGEP